MSRAQKGWMGIFGITTILIFINVVVFLALSLIGLFYRLAGKAAVFEQVTSLLVLNPALFFQGHVWTIITSMFMHANLTHLFVNMVSLFFLGMFIEKLIGRKRYLLFYLVSGIIAGLFFVFLAAVGSAVPSTVSLFGTLEISAVGASGAIFGLGGLLAVLLPRMKVLVFFVIPMRLWAAMLVLMFGLWVFSAVAGLPIGNSAHFGGLLVGLVYGFYLRGRFPKKIQMLNRMFGS